MAVSPTPPKTQPVSPAVPPPPDSLDAGWSSPPGQGEDEDEPQGSEAPKSIK